MVEIKKYLEENFEKVNTSLFDNIYTINLNKKNDQIYIVYCPNLINMEEFIHKFCIYFDNKEINFHCYEILIITNKDVPYFRGCIEERGIKFFNIMKINNNEKNIVCGKPYFLQGIRMKKIIKKIKSLTNYSLKFIG